MKKNNNSLLTFSIGALLGAAVFIMIFGISVISPTNTDWIFTMPDDSGQHYLGWVFFRKTPWTFPICLTDGLTSDGMVSCMYSDSIPIMAVFFKLLSPVLPETFQYLGIWGVICFALNGGFGSVLLYRITSDITFAVTGSMFYSAFIPSIARITHHNSLGAIWLIIIPLILCTERKNSRNWLPWAVTCAVAVMIHVYFVPMIYMVMLGHIIMLVFHEKKVKNAVITFSASTVAVILTMWITGAFYGRGSYVDGGYGLFSANLNTFVNSMGYSRFLPVLDSMDGQGEGFGYLGLGMIICVVICMISAVIYRGKISAYVRSHRVEAVSLCIVFAVSFLWAVTSRITFNNHIIIDIPLPGFVISCLSVFRASGRFIWLPCLIVITASLGILSWTWKKAAILAAAFCFAVQTADISQWSADTHSFYSQCSDNYSLKDSKWNELTMDTSEVVFLPLPADHLAYMQLYFDFARLADAHDMRLSSFYLARSDIDSIKAYADEQYTMLCSHKGRKDVLYVFFNSNDAPDASDVNVYNIDGYTVAKIKK